MDDAGDTASRLRAGLEPYVKPREQASYIRRVLALYLGSLMGDDGPAVAPLSLVDGTRDVVDGGVETSGPMRDYLRALQANLAARREFDRLLQAAGQMDDADDDDDHHDHHEDDKDTARGRQTALGAGFLHEHLALLQVRRKRECLLAVERSLDRLAERPASFPSFLDADDVFHAARPLPAVPQAVLDSFVAEQSAAARPRAQTRLQQLERTALRAKLLQKQEERLLDQARARHGGRQDAGNGAKLQALAATRDELIGWIEAELGKASGEGPPQGAPEAAGGEAGAGPSAALDGEAVEARLGQIQQKYAKYVAARRRILGLAAAGTQRPSMPPPERHASPASQPEESMPKPGPVDHLVTPYLEKLVALSRRQKDTMAQKSHANAALRKQARDTCQVLDRLADESQLLPSHAAKEPPRPRSGLGREAAAAGGGASARPEARARVRQWVRAAEAAKIATLEAVAEAIERGQVALEQSMQTVQEMDELLGTGAGAHAAGEEEDGAAAEHAAGAAAEAGARTMAAGQAGDAWSALHGNLGSLGQGNGAS